MAKIEHLITRQDFDAFADDPSANARTSAVLQRLSEDDGAFFYVMELKRINSDLLAAKAKIYEDEELLAIVQRLRERKHMRPEKSGMCSRRH